MKIKILLPILILLLAGKLFSQNPIKWEFESVKKEQGIYNLKFKAQVQKPWHLYSHDMGQGGPIPTSFHYENSSSIEFIGNIATSTEPIAKMDQMFNMEVRYFDADVVFTQTIRNKSNSKIELKGFVEYMCCDDTQCLPPDEEYFTFELEPAKPLVKINTIDVGNKTKDEINSVDLVQTKGHENINVIDSSVDVSKMNYAEKEIVSANDVNQQEDFSGGDFDADKGVWLLFFLGFGGGLLALLTPCVYPMIPLTVSMFMKGNNRAKGVARGITYGLSIVVIYVGLGWGIALLFGADVLNWIATDPWVNIVLFTLLVVFAISFFGAFEITLPSSWSNALDKKADNSTGLMSIFFMALTLAVVSFSCTGPIIGSTISQAASQGSQAGVISVMLGFSLALAIPFTLFAIFPSMLQGLPKSGGWLNSVKVVLGFLELALALKFFATADMVSHWGILSRSTFIAIWVVIFILMGVYLLGKIKFAHDSDIKYVSVPRLFLAIISFSFALYLLPGLWGAPLHSISAFAPHMHTQEFNLSKLLYEQPVKNTSVNEHTTEKKYSDKLECPMGIDCFFDYDEALAYAKEVNKPLLLDFTGHGCTNCREMEANVWSKPEILESLKNDFVIASLYVDDRTELPESEQFEAEINGKLKKISTLGKKMVEFQNRRFKVIAQPYYVILGLNEELLEKPRGRNLDVEAYKKFLDTGIERFNNKYK